MKIGLIGDYQDSVTAHRAIPTALGLAANEISEPVEFSWLHSSQISEFLLDNFDGLWCVPASPYENDENVLSAINYARKNNVPFLGTCGGYQYAALEFAKTELGYTNAENVEVIPDTPMPLISNLSCKLYDETAPINLIDNSVIAKVYGKSIIKEEYYCGYGVNSEYLHIYEGTDMFFSGFDEDGDPRCLEIAKNGYFIGTAFQPERSALKGLAHPLICAYLLAIRDAQQSIAAKGYRH